MYNVISKARKGKIKSLGYGGKAYFSTLSVFIEIFIVLSVINWILMGIYSSYSGFDGMQFTTYFSPYSIGNLG